MAEKKPVKKKPARPVKTKKLTTNDGKQQKVVGQGPAQKGAK